jgi:hypothetical protein
MIWNIKCATQSFEEKSRSLRASIILIIFSKVMWINLFYKIKTIAMDRMHMIDSCLSKRPGEIYIGMSTVTKKMKEINDEEV